MGKKLGIYVGLRDGRRELVRSVTEPTEQSHGDKYNCTIGPFRTIRGAKACVHYGNNNPHIQTVSDAERIGKEHAEELKELGLSN